MKTKLALLTTLAAGTMLLAGCAAITPKANTNTAGVTNANAAVANTNSVVVKNDNANGGANVNQTSNSNIDTSGWQTYANTEYGFSLDYPNSVTIDDSYTQTSNFNTTNTYTLIQLSLNSSYPSQVFSINVAANELNTVINQIMTPDVAVSTSKSNVSLSGKDLTAISVNGSEGSKIVYAYEVDNKTILISVPDNSDYINILNTIQFTK